jgi:hypothetical protein
MITDPSTPTHVRFPKAFATDANMAMDQLFAVFTDQYPALVGEDATHWTFARGWPCDPSWYVDPEIERHARRLYSCDLSGLASYSSVDVVAGIPIVFAMFHSRALLAPALAYELHGVTHFQTIVHVDDHADLMPALVSVRSGMLLASTSQRRIDLDSRDSIECAIDEGAVSIGSFLTAYMLGKPPGRYIHVKRSGACTMTLVAPQVHDVPLADCHIEATVMEPVTSGGHDAWVLEEVRRLPVDLHDGSGAVWLDVDMDGFCNRYDGDSNRGTRPPTMRERVMTHRHIDEFLSDLRAASWTRQIAAVSIAASPGFFPSDLWEEMIPVVRRGIEDVLTADSP